MKLFIYLTVKDFMAKYSREQQERVILKTKKSKNERFDRRTTAE